MTMSEERAKHLELAGVVKGVHARLRREFRRGENDMKDIWQEHTKNTGALEEYASAMHQLATEHWGKHDSTRIDWCREICLEYFYGGLLQKCLRKEDKSKGVLRDESSDKTHERASNTNNLEAGGDDSQIAQLENIRDYSSVERDDLPDGCVSQREGPDGSVFQRDGCPDGSVNERPIPDGSLNYRDGLSRPAKNIGGLHNPRKSVQLPFEGPIFLLDVGSCYNPLHHFEEFCVAALDLHPATEDVLQCDFLDCAIVDNPKEITDEIARRYSDPDIYSYHGNEGCKRTDAIGCNSASDCDFYPSMLRSPVTQLPTKSFDVVLFSLLLEYLPCCKQRFDCCQKAWEVLRTNGLFLVISPDSHRQHRNASMIRSWKQCLEGIGFQRIRYVKQEHIHCMAFRRLESAVLDVSPDPEMMYIPQDFHEDEGSEDETHTEYEPEEIIADFSELPNFIPC